MLQQFLMTTAALLNIIVLAVLGVTVTAFALYHMGRR